ncbi:MAG: aminoacyl--tRNA ligase-related protein [Patescibacteria group bacterium]
MKLSQLFTRTQKQAPADEVAVNAQLLTRGGFVFKNSAGVYSYLPLGWRVIQKIAGIIREEMDAVGGQEIFMPALVEKKYLEATGRWDVAVGFEAKGKEEKSAGFVLGWTHEEVLTAIASKFVSSYKDLPFSAYQIQTKFRNEARAKSGLLRGREFMMKDLYSFHTSEEDLMAYYGKVAEAYKRIFERCGLAAVYTLAAGGEFTMANTHEFQVVAEAGEDTIFVCEKCDYAENKEISKLEDGGKCEKCGGVIKEEKSIEVGNIFPLGTKYSKAFGLKYRDEKGEEKDVVMGSYGIGLGRVMATAVEVYHDEKGILWSEALAPFKVHLVELEGGDGVGIYKDLQKNHVEVLFDDREVSAGEKFAEADLLGMPWRLVTSKKTEGKVEVKKRGEEKSEVMEIEEFVKQLKM